MARPRQQATGRSTTVWSSTDWVNKQLIKSRQTYLCIYTGHHSIKIVAYSDAMSSPKVVVHNCNTHASQSKL